MFFNIRCFISQAPQPVPPPALPPASSVAVVTHNMSVPPPTYYSAPPYTAQPYVMPAQPGVTMSAGPVAPAPVEGAGRWGEAGGYSAPPPQWQSHHYYR
ncbi:unnamed protein product [Plutella xylostella]|uniref:(diamondback moth) hypothetical protein n=1 Tax=Plutella xylostella TaxID=51655 RepID=A0A8S4EIH9_PLUXY|nr:unnamed protein product [Plutella xylostella]